MMQVARLKNPGLWLGALCAFVLLGHTTRAGEDRAAARYRDEIEPILADTCYGCHGDGMKKGGVAFDGFPSEDALVKDRELWWSVLKNVRAGVMPPAGKDRPSREQVRLLEDWIKRGAFGIDPQDPDPGRVTIRRLNRVEYRNTIRDLMGIDFRADEEFPPDDTGYGFDTIGDVLTVSPLLLEKYMQAAEVIVAEAVPSVSKVVPKETISAFGFRGPDAKGDKMSFYKAARVSHNYDAPHKGTYRLVVSLDVRGQFDFDPGRCKVVFTVDDGEKLREEFGWASGKTHRYEFKETWKPGKHALAFELEPLTPPEKKVNAARLAYRLGGRRGAAGARALGPVEELRPLLHPRRPRHHSGAPRVRSRDARPLRA